MFFKICVVTLVKDIVKVNRNGYSILAVKKLLSCITFIFGYEVFIRKLSLNSYIINGLILYLFIFIFYYYFFYLFLFKELFFSLFPELFHIVRIYNDSYTFLMTCYLYSFNLLLNIYLLGDIFLT